jgi:acetyl-CoA C-acetyltransferase
MEQSYISSTATKGNLKSMADQKPISGRLPVIIGVGRITQRNFDGTPSEFLSEAVQVALNDTVRNAKSGAKQELAQSISDVATIRMAVEDRFRNGTNCEPYKNLAQQVAKLSGTANDTQKYYATSSGGSTPQMLVNVFAERIAKGESECAVMVGGECLDAFFKQMMKAKSLPNWGAKYEETQVTKPVDATLGKYAGDATGITDVEKKNGLIKPTQMYPLLEQAYRAERGDTLQGNIERNSKLFHRFNEVAATKEDKLAWFPQRRTARDIGTESASNRWVSFPYPK